MLPPAAALPDDAIEVGQVLAPRGVYGELRVRPYSGSADVLLACARWFLRLQPTPEPGAPASGAGEAVIALDIERAELQGAELRVQAAAVTSRDVAERLQRAAVLVSRSEFPSLPSGQYYWIDLIGLRVVNRAGEKLGIVRDLMETGPNQVLVVVEEGMSQATSNPRLIPFVDAWVDGVDFDARQITVSWQLDY